ncbi:MAG: hypothetical protein ABI885_24825 [Gammaproteobacteria bacterium]
MASGLDYAHDGLTGKKAFQHIEADAPTSWFDAHLWAYADERGIDTLWSEGFEHGRLTDA